MIVADTNLIAYLLIAGPFSDDAQKVFDRDEEWIAPTVWYHEFLNVLATSVREGHLTADGARRAWVHAPAFVRDAEVPPLEVLDLAMTTRTASYDCNFVVLARKLGLALVTADKKILRDHGDVAVGLKEFAERP